VPLWAHPPFQGYHDKTKTEQVQQIRLESDAEGSSNILGFNAGFQDLRDLRSDISGILRILGRTSGIDFFWKKRIYKYFNGLRPNFKGFRSGFMNFGPDLRDSMSDLKGFRPFSRGFTSGPKNVRDFFGFQGF